MKKFFILFFMILLCFNKVMADDDWGSVGDIQEVEMPDKPQFFSDQDFQKAVESKKRKPFFVVKKKDKNIPKGENYRQSDETDTIINTKTELPILLVPMELAAGNSVIEPGYYQVSGEKADGKPVLKLYQSHALVAALPAVETNDDFNQQYVNFVNLIQQDSGHVKIIFGNIDFNAYTVVNLYDKIGQ